MPRAALVLALVALAACGGDGGVALCEDYCGAIEGPFDACDPMELGRECDGNCACLDRCRARLDPSCEDALAAWNACNADEATCDPEACQEEGWAARECWVLTQEASAPAVARCEGYCGGIAAGSACDPLGFDRYGDRCVAACAVDGVQGETSVGGYCASELEAWNACAGAADGCAACGAEADALVECEQDTPL
jgi:hypothetical protein